MVIIEHFLNMKNKITLILIIIFAQLIYSQVHSVSIYADYSSALSKRLEVTEATAFGGAAKIKVNLFDNFSIGILGGYKLYSVSEPDVLNTWGWIFWTDRYYTKIVSDLRADPNLAVEISAEQTMDLIPIQLFIDYDFIPFNDFIITPSLGAGFYFYTRSMFAVENWSKYFPEAQYTFSYSYRNFAPDKKGNPLFINGGLNVEYRLFEKLNLYSGLGYNYVIPTEGKMGYDAFPFESEFAIKVGISILY